MGEMVEFKSNGDTARGYLATPDTGSGPGVIVVQEWWGLNPQIKGVADKLAAEGFVALAPDLYRGELAGHDEMDKAGQLMTTLPMDRAARDMSGAVDYLANHSAATGDGIGAVGFCMGGGLVWALGCLRPDKVAAVVPFYGVVGFDDANAPDWSKLEASVQGHYAEKDDFFNPEAVHQLEGTLREAGVDVEMFIYAGADHAFFNDTRPEVYDEETSRTAWIRTLEFFRAKLG